MDSLAVQMVGICTHAVTCPAHTVVPVAAHSVALAVHWVVTVASGQTVWITGHLVGS